MKKVPYVWIYQDDSLVVNEDEQLIIDAIQHFKRGGLTIDEIVSRLQLAGCSLDNRRARYEHFYLFLIDNQL